MSGETTGRLRVILWISAAVLALLTLVGHLPKLDKRPMHTDEAVHAVKLGTLLETGEYIYDPHEYHGPVIYYLAAPFARVAGAHDLASIPDESPLRMPIVISLALLVLAVAVSGTHLGVAGSLFAGVVVATSPAFGFYGRYFIQEVPFVLACYCALACSWKLLTTARWPWAVGTALGWGAAIALKETWILITGTAAFTALLLQMTSNHRPWPRAFPWQKFARLFFVTGLCSVAVGLMLLSNFLRNPVAVMDGFRSIAGYLMRGVSGDSSTFGAGIHDHPWHYYLQLFIWPKVSGPWVWTEAGTIALAVMGIVSIIRRWNVSGGPWHFIMIFTVLITAFYSAIPYKTPWNGLPILLGWVLLAGRGFAALVAWPKSWTLKGLIALGLMAWPVLLGIQTYRATIKRPADFRNPYAYSPTSPSVYELKNRMDALAAVGPGHDGLSIMIFSPDNDYWPLPWYLRRFAQVGYFTDAAELNEAADVIINTAIAKDEDTEQAVKIPGERQAEFYGLRPDIPMTVNIRKELWDAFMKIRQ